jgi:hypothetical protein
VKHRLSPQSVDVPLFGYFAVVGGFLLSMLLVANVFLPATMVDGGGETRQSKPKILIDSSRNLPERIVYDTSLPTTLAVVPVAQEAAPRSSPLDSMAQMSAPTTPKQPSHVQIVREKPVKIAKRVSRQKFASFQQQRPPNLFASWW